MSGDVQHWAINNSNNNKKEEEIELEREKFIKN
jgi:hypothetical protein